MRKGTKLIVYDGMGLGMGIFLKCGYGDGHYGTLPNRYPLPSLFKILVRDQNKVKITCKTKNMKTIRENHHKVEIT